MADSSVVAIIWAAVGSFCALLAWGAHRRRRGERTKRSDTIGFSVMAGICYAFAVAAVAGYPIIVGR